MNLTSLSKSAGALALCAALAGCGSPSAKEHAGPAGEPAAPEEESWSLTSWGQLYEIFPETRPLVAGAVALSHTHVTALADFSPLKTGGVVAVLRGTGPEQSFAGTFKRDGIFEIPFRPAREGVYDLAFRVDGPAGREEIPAGKVMVGRAGAPGALAEPPAPPNGAAPSEGATETPFLKEQQWKTEFATQWVREGTARHAVRGSARVRPIAGGEVVLTAPVDAMVASQPWPHVGLAVARGSSIFRLSPSVSSARSLPELAGDVSALEAEAGAARARADRLEGLLKLEAVSPAEVERARAAATALEARLRAARQDLGSANAARTGSGGGTPLTLRAPWSGVVASVDVSPGQSVAAGTALGRLVKSAPLWLEIALRPEDAAALGSVIEAVNVRRSTGTQAQTTSLSNVRFVSRAPEIDPRTGAQTVTLEVSDAGGVIAIGSVVEAEILLPGGRPGTAIPASSLIDDGGISVVYVQLSGEAFARREVRVVGRAGDSVTVSGLRAGERLVTRGGAAIRRASLLSTGAPEGHVH
jgi:membrane fusion protein, heavy metal efflux system